MRYHWQDIAILVVSAALVFGRLIGYDFILFYDDNAYVVNNPNVHGFSWSNIRAAFAFSSIGQYNPLALLSFMLDYTLWGIRAGGYHLTNIVIHALNGILVYLLFSRWYDNRLLSLTVSLVFLLHPVQVESVAWISERKGLLSMLFFLLSWKWYCRYSEAVTGKGGRAYLFSLLFYLLSLMAKSMTVVMPLVLILYDYCFLRKSRDMRFIDKVPFIVFAALFSAIEMFSELPESGGGRVGYHGGSPLATFYTMLPVFCRYLAMLVWPSGLSVEYWPPVHRSVDVEVILAALLLSALALLGIRIFRSDRRLGFWLLFFWVGLLPVSQIVPLLLMMFDHYLYLPIIGAGAVAGCTVVSLREKMGTERSRYLYLLLFACLLALAVTSFNRCAVWQNSLTLWHDASVKTPQSFRSWWFLGESYQDLGKTEAAVRSFEKSLAVNPVSTDVLWALGDLYTETGELDKGYGLLRRLTEINPAYVKGWASIGNNYRNRGDYSKADEMYRRALALQPEAMQVVVLRGRLALMRGDFGAARDLLKQVEAQGWGDPENAYLLASVESMAGRVDAALTWLEEALRRGYRNFNALDTSRELSLVRNDPRFAMLISRYFPGQ